MKILLTNDDGITAPGIAALYDAIASLGEVFVVAPAGVQSAMSHGITFHKPLMTREVQVNARMRGISVEGTPADCVKLGLRTIWVERFGADSRPDLVISGMNGGANVGINVIYSGTVAAAIEAAFLGVPAIAVSLHLGGSAAIEWVRAAQIARHAIDCVIAHPLDAHRVISINVPRTEGTTGPMPPIRVVRMNTAAGIDRHERRESPEGHAYYWPCGNGMDFFHTAQGSDVEALAERNITITPLWYDLTDDASLSAWQERLHGQ
ncbi:MAG: 5'/3'-nucleotidase SurE [Phycisphaerales bacterium]|nr:5'/3'-nucleotidase SurE [Phycisphaerales bacterium]